MYPKEKVQSGEDVSSGKLLVLLYVNMHPYLPTYWWAIYAILLL